MACLQFNLQPVAAKTCLFLILGLGPLGCYVDSKMPTRTPKPAYQNEALSGSAHHLIGDVQESVRLLSVVLKMIYRDSGSSSAEFRKSEPTILDQVSSVFDHLGVDRIETTNDQSFKLVSDALVLDEKILAKVRLSVEVTGRTDTSGKVDISSLTVHMKKSDGKQDHEIDFPILKCDSRAGLDCEFSLDSLGNLAANIGDSTGVEAAQRWDGTLRLIVGANGVSSLIGERISIQGKSKIDIEKMFIVTKSGSFAVDNFAINGRVQHAQSDAFFEKAFSGTTSNFSADPNQFRLNVDEGPVDQTGIGP